MLHKLGFEALPDNLAEVLVNQTLELLEAVDVGYHNFFIALTQQFSPQWRAEADQIFAATLQASDPAAAALLQVWQQEYHRCLKALPESAMATVAQRLQSSNPKTVLLRPEIEAVWEPITVEDDWQPFYGLLQRIQQPFS
jgi:uncharacterized protein YdiU (UPF0061 family)